MAQTQTPRELDQARTEALKAYVDAYIRYTVANERDNYQNNIELHADQSEEDWISGALSYDCIEDDLSCSVWEIAEQIADQFKNHKDEYLKEPTK